MISIKVKKKKNDAGDDRKGLRILSSEWNKGWNKILVTFTEGYWIWLTLEEVSRVHWLKHYEKTRGECKSKGIFV